MCSSDSYSSDSDSSSPTRRRDPAPELSSSIFRSYPEKDSESLAKIQSFLTLSSSNALSCLICLERIKHSHPTWQCSSRCFAIFHLHCIQSWAQQSITSSQTRALTRSPVPVNDESLVWPCPKCRIEYPKTVIPKHYYCFCGKVQDPIYDPWVFPHSCGEICGKSLKYDCGHSCLLLCHPGSCPACPKMVKCRCFCGKVDDVRRCGFKEFSCSNVCGKILECGIHKCNNTCHEGFCSPCRIKGLFTCRCGKVKMEKECCERTFRCENECGKKLECGRHFCSKGCHEGKCGECPMQGKRTCPCGKKVYEGMACDVEAPVCGGSCNKVMSCGYHRCPDRCHRGDCVETCRTVVTKSCRCGSFKKQVPCHQELTCDRKCQTLRDCGRHACKRRCCDGDCPPCSEICDKRLRCRNHKCAAPCHRGACAPCPLMVRISCACGATHIEVPCGAETEQKPPKCSKQCRVAPLCSHRFNCKPHRCHYGACPPCRLICDEQYQCGHKCKLRCHGPKPPPLPEYSLKPKKKKSSHLIEATPGSSCPPCPEIVIRSCVGQHIGAEKMMVCSNRAEFSCDNLCGNPLPCGNHYCTYVCHPLKRSRSSRSDGDDITSESCEQCTLPCDKKRDRSCPHPCPVRCHPGECPPCKTLIKRSCHCGSMVHVFECNKFNSMSEKEQASVRSCKGPCHRKLPNCPHLCPETCHPGPCPQPEKCSKKVSARCRCQTIKKEWPCYQVQEAYQSIGRDSKDVSKNQYGVGLIPCDDINCKRDVKVPEAELHFRQPKPREEKENDDKVGNVTKRRKRKQRVHESMNISPLQKIVAAIRRVVLFLVIAITIIASVYYGYKGLMWLNHWMNENEARQRRRGGYPRI